MANEVKIGFNLDLSKLPQQAEKARALIDKAVSDAEKKIEDYQDRLKKGEGDTNFATKEADGIRKAISALEKQVEALKKITSIQSLKEDLASLNKEIEDYHKKGLNNETFTKAIGLDEKIKTLSEARDALSKERQDEFKFLGDLKSEREALSKDALSKEDRADLESELKELKEKLATSKELEASFEKLYTLREKLSAASGSLREANAVGEINSNKLNSVQDSIKYYQSLLDKSEEGKGKRYESRLATLQEEEKRLQEIVDGWREKGQAATDFLMSNQKELDRLLDITDGADPFDFDKNGDISRVHEGLESQIADLEDILSKGKEVEEPFKDINTLIEESETKLNGLYSQLNEVTSELQSAQQERSAYAFDEKDIAGYRTDRSMQWDYQQEIKNATRAYKTIADIAEQKNIDINNQIAADSQAAQDKLIDGFGQKVSKLSDMLSGELSLEDLTKAVELYNELTEEADKFAESSDDGDWDDRLDGWLNKLGSLKQKIDELYPELSKNLKHVENSEPVEETASTEERKTAIVDVKSLQDVINKKKELAQEQREYVEELRAQRDLMAQEATSKGDFSGDTYKLLDLQLAQATDKMYDMELETEHLIEKAADFRRSLQEIDDANGIDELEESLDRLLETYGEYQNMRPEGGYAGDDALNKAEAVDRLHDSFEYLKNAGVEVDQVRFNGAIKSADDLANALNGVSDEIGEVHTPEAELERFKEGLEEVEEEADDVSSQSRWDAISSGISSVVTSLQPVATAFRYTFSLLSTGFSFAKDAAGAFKDTIISVSSTLGGVALKGVTTLSKGFVELSKNLLGINAIKSVWSSISGLFDRIAKLASLAFVFRVITQGFRRIKNDVVEAFNTYLNYDNSLSASVNDLKNQFATLKAQLASAFAPIISIVTPILSQLVSWCLDAANAVSALIAALTGQSSWKKAVVTSTGAVSQGASNATKDLEDTADAADELKEKLGSYDKLNVIQDESDSKKSKSGSGAGGGGAGGGGNGSNISYIDQNIGNKISDLADWLKGMWDKADFTELGTKLGEKLKDALEKIPWDKIKQTARKIGKSFATLLNGFIEVPDLGFTIGKTIGEAINTGLELISGFVDYFHFKSFGRFLADGINGIIYTLDWDKAASIIRKGINGIVTALTEALDPINGIDFHTLGSKIGNFVKDATSLDFETAKKGFHNLGTGIADFVNSLASTGAVSTLGTNLAGVVNSIVQAFNGLATQINPQLIGQEIAKALNNFFSTVDWKTLGFTFETAAGKVADIIRTAINGITWDDKFEFASTIGTSIANAFNKVITVENLSAVASFFANSINTLITGAHSFFTNADWSEWGNAIGASINRFFNTINWVELGVTLNSALTGLMTLFKNTVTTIDWKGVGENIGLMLAQIDWENVLKTAADTAIAAIQGLFTTLVSIITTASWSDYDESVKNILTNSTKLNQEAGTLINKRSELESTGEGEKKLAQDLADKYFALAGKENKTNEEEEKLRHWAEQLVDIYPEMNGLIDKQTGLISGTKEEVYKLIEAYSLQAKQKGYLAYLDELYKEQAKIKIQKSEIAGKVAELVVAFGQYSVSLDEAKEMAKGNIKKSKEYADAMSGLREEYGLTESEVFDLLKQEEDLTTTEGELNDTIETTQDDLAKLTSEDYKVTVEGDTSGVNQAYSDAEQGAQKTNNLKVDVGINGVITNWNTNKQQVSTDKTNLENNPAKVPILGDAAGWNASASQVGQEKSKVGSGVLINIGGKKENWDTSVKQVNTDKDTLENDPVIVDYGYDKTKYDAGYEAVKKQNEQIRDETTTAVFDADDTAYQSVAGEVTQTNDKIGQTTETTVFDGDNAPVASVAEQTATALEDVPNEKKVSFIDVGGAALAALATLVIKAAINSIPDEKKVTFKIEDKTKETIKNIKDAIKSVQTYTNNTVLSGIKTDINNALSAIKTSVEEAMTGSNSIKSKVQKFESTNKTVILSQIERDVKQSLENIKTLVETALNGGGGIKGKVDSLKSTINTILTGIVGLFRTGFASCRDVAIQAISAIQRAINGLSGKDVTIFAKMDNESYNRVMSDVNELAENRHSYLYIDIIWRGSTSVTLSSNWAEKGGVFKNGRWNSLPQMASGGLFHNGFWDSIPMYAGGTTKAHGTMFIAGENGAEIVGNIGGRTEVLNKSQLAATMFSSVRSAMGDTGADLANAIIMNMVSAANAMITNIVYVSEVLKEGFNGVYEVVNGAATLSHADWADYFKKFGDYVNATSKGFGRLEELSQLQREMPKAITSNADLEYKRMLEIYNGVNRRLEMACDILREIEIANKGGNEMQMHIDLDGTTIYERMVQLDKGYSRITGISGFGG